MTELATLEEQPPWFERAWQPLGRDMYTLTALRHGHVTALAAAVEIAELANTEPADHTVYKVFRFDPDIVARHLA